MITPSNRKDNTNKLALTSRSFLMTAVAAAVLNSVAYAQTNSSSGINRRAAETAAQAPASSTKTTVTKPTVAARAKAPAKKVAKTTRARRVRQTSSQRAVKITIRGDRNDVRQARQQGIQSLQNANAAVAARNAQREADANAAAQATADANNAPQQSYYGYGYAPGFSDPSFGYGTNMNGAMSTAQPVGVGATPYGAPNVTFPSFYTNTYGGGIYSTYTTLGTGNINPLGFYGY